MSDEREGLMTLPTDDAVKAARLRLEAWGQRTESARDWASRYERERVRDLRTILSALAAAKERAATLERERDEAVRKTGTDGGA